MDVNEFSLMWQNFMSQEFPTFVENLKPKNNNLGYADWIKIWVRWMEISDDNDIDTFYENEI